ncbi:MAG: hypothetical protein NTY61_03850, partial [Candidatus Parcubacteria bacterium]|nr:hypothetical protein [Candidatus Parcubacteria bacterium]
MSIRQREKRGNRMGLKFEGDLLVFGERRIVPAIRTVSEMSPVLAFLSKKNPLPPSTPTYFMYRGVLRFGNIRYDVTRILPLDLCGEKNKTFGHSHPISPSGVAWPEIYEVLDGTAHFLIQKL